MAARRWAEQDGLVLGLVVLAAIVTLDGLLGPSIVVSGSYAVAAVVASATASVRHTAFVAGLALVLSALAGTWNQNLGTLDWVIRLVLTAGLGALGIVSATVRVRREKALRHMTVIAETAQRAVLRAMPSAVGSVGFAARYVSATQEALVGGDLYEVAASPYGVRVIVGDVRGKGLDAVQLAATVLGAFRRAAFTQQSLASIAVELDEVVRIVAGDEDFVTAILAEFHEDHTVTLVNCGHHPPMLVTGAGIVDLLSTGEPSPPLGLGTTPDSVTSVWPGGSRMLIYTDGLVEARDRRGAFFPVADHALELSEGSLDEALDGLIESLTDHVGNQVRDDLALVMAEQRA